VGRPARAHYRQSPTAGIRGEAIVDAMVELGTSTSNVDLAMSSIYANNRDLIDEETDRAFPRP